MSRLLKILRFIFEYAVDCINTLRFNNYSPFEEKNHRIFYHILIETHTIEKGLSLPNPRSLFGKSKINSLIKLTNNYDLSFSTFPIQMLVGALRDYLRLHEMRNIVDAPVLDQIREFLNAHPEFNDLDALGGAKDVTSVYPLSEPKDSIKFLQSRYSCRNFNPAPLDPTTVREIVSIAQSAPSQCNRQTARVHYYSDPQIINRLLELQGGSGGFRQNVGNLFVVSSEMTGWGGPGQRNQAYVDGALFSMLLMLTCHAHSIATCPLNLAKMNATEKQIKTYGDIPQRERLIMMIGIGKPVDDTVLAAQSPRLPVEDVLSLH